jgi:hypothetical protein
MNTLHDVVAEMGRRGAAVEMPNGDHICAFCQTKVMDATFDEFHHHALCPWPKLETILYGDQISGDHDTGSEANTDGQDHSLPTALILATSAGIGVGISPN